MRVIGIDPGTRVLGYCILDIIGSDIACLTFGTILGGSSKEVAYRLEFLYSSLKDIIEDWKPDTLAIEEPFVAPHRGAKSAILVGQAQSVALILAVQHGITVNRYSPTKVKSLIASYGAGTKQQVQASVRMLLGLGQEPIAEDASDAIAIALCHAYQMRTSLSVNLK